MNSKKYFLFLCSVPAILSDICLALLPWQLQVDVDANLLEFDSLHLLLAIDAGLRTRHLAAFFTEGLHLDVLANLALNRPTRNT